MGDSLKTSIVTASQSQPDPSSLFGFDNVDSKSNRSDGSSNGHTASKFSSGCSNLHPLLVINPVSIGLIRKAHYLAFVPESWEGSMDDEAEEEPAPKEGREERRRIKQRERRQKWRHKEREKIVEADGELRLKMQALALDWPTSLPAAYSVADAEEPTVYKPTKGHRSSPQERTLLFLTNLFRYDTRPADWDLVCVEQGEYAIFPDRQLVLPLSRLSALVWKIEYDGRRLTALASKGLEEIENALVRKERELVYYRKHLRNWQLIWGSWRKYSGKLDVLAVKHTVRALFYGNVVLSRVTAQLDAQKQELTRQIREIQKRDIPENYHV
ncbi:hypothetical protein HD806DRAFT_271876 [Xylariaceae sp. AK1471]|nr:hypothetical protein HD806DRAFT_271876 [Xylariaceae sp. AK1471]